MSTETLTNLPFCNVGPVFGTKLPRMMPIAMASSIHTARNPSNQLRPLNAKIWSGTITALISWFSASSACPGVCGTGALSRDEPVSVVLGSLKRRWLLKSDANGFMMLVDRKICWLMNRLMYSIFQQDLVAQQ
jgi:hypothetical protein